MFERLRGGFRVRFWEPDWAGVGHVGGEEGGKHFIGDVVVGGDVEAGVCECVRGTGEGSYGGGKCRCQGGAV